nr:response regulator [uncultured Pseudomonas sp.]
MLKPILLVEDDLRDVELILTALERSQLANQVVTVRDGAEALDYLHCRGMYANRKGDNPAVILLDLKLPKVNGLQVLADIQSSAHLRTIPTVMLTSSNESPDLSEAYRLGVNAYVVKPVRFADFVHAVGAVGAFWAITNEIPPSRSSGG